MWEKSPWPAHEQPCVLNNDAAKEKGSSQHRNTGLCETGAVSIALGIFRSGRNIIWTLQNPLLVLALPRAAAAALGEASWTPQVGKGKFCDEALLAQHPGSFPIQQVPSKENQTFQCTFLESSMESPFPCPWGPSISEDRCFRRVSASPFLPWSLVSFCFIIKSAQSLLDIEQQFSIEPWNQRLDWVGKELEDQFIPPLPWARTTLAIPGCSFRPCQGF